MSDTFLCWRISRRETRSSKAVLVITLAVIVIVLIVYLGAEIILNMLGAPPLLTSPASLASTVSTTNRIPSGYLLGFGVLAAVIGMVLLIAAVSAGRRPRRLLNVDGSAVVVDNEVIASALARHASLAGGVDPDNTTVSVEHRTAIVRLTPATGRPGHRSTRRPRRRESGRRQPAGRVHPETCSEGKSHDR